MKNFCLISGVALSMVSFTHSVGVEWIDKVLLMASVALLCVGIYIRQVEIRESQMLDQIVDEVAFDIEREARSFNGSPNEFSQHMLGKLQR